MIETDKKRFNLIEFLSNLIVWLKFMSQPVQLTKLIKSVYPKISRNNGIFS